MSGIRQYLARIYACLHSVLELMHVQKYNEMPPLRTVHSSLCIFCQ